MDFSKIAKYGIPLLCILLLAASVPAPIFSVDEPDGTNDDTSAYYTVTWTPQFDHNGPDANMIAGANTITCYAQGENSGYDTSKEMFNGVGCCDGNRRTVNVSALGGRSGGVDYYVWCINDQNSDMNAYSSGQFNLSRFQTNDIGSLVIDFVGGVFGGVVFNIEAVGLLIVISIILLFLLDILTGVFGVVKMLQELAKRR